MPRALLPALIAAVWLSSPVLGPSAAAAAEPKRDAAFAGAPLPPPAAAPPQALAVQAFLWNTSPVALKAGLVLGGGVEARYSLGEGGLSLGARLAAGQTSEATQEWSLTHVHMLACLQAGLEARFGLGRLQAQLAAGMLGIRQLGRRQQYERLEAAGIAGLRRDRWSFGPVVTLEVGAAVVLFDPWRVFLQLGPGVTVQRVAGSRVARALLSSSVGVGRAF